MPLDEKISGFIGRLYEAPYEAEAWRSVMAELMELTGSRIAFVSAVDLRNQAYNRALFYGPEESSVETGTREYAEETFALDPSLQWASQHPHAGVCETEVIIPRSEYLEQPFIKWNKARFGTTHWRVFYTPPVDDLTFALSLHPPAEIGPPPKELKALHFLLFEHMERAMRLAVRPPDFSRDSGAVIALDHHGRIIALSPAADALVALNDGLTTESRYLVASHPLTAKPLQLAIRSAIQAHLGGGAGGGIKVKRPSGKPDWLAVTSPYPRFLDHLPIRAPAAVVRIIEISGHANFTTQHAQIFDLTPREIEIARALLDGHSVETLSSCLQISPNTARVHLRGLFRKTQTNRQSDLVRVLAAIAQT
jgi:DNA-binding CsgD family transcriptional regulator